MKETCPHCGGTGEIDVLAQIREECIRLGYRILWPDLVSEECAAVLLGYRNAQTFRKSKAFGSLRHERLQGNRRLYSLKKIFTFSRS